MAKQAQSTVKSLRKSWRQEGRIARSRMLTFSLVLLAAIGGLNFFAENFAQASQQLVHDGLSTGDLKPENIVDEIRILLSKVLLIVAPLLGLCAAVAVTSELLQAGFSWNISRVAPDFKRISPMQSIRRYVQSTYWNFVSGMLLKGVSVLAISVCVLWSERAAILQLYEMESIVAGGSKLLLRLGGKAAFALVVVGIVDFAIRRWLYERALEETSKQRKSQESDEQRASSLSTKSISDSERRQYQEHHVGRDQTSSLR